MPELFFQSRQKNLAIRGWICQCMTRYFVSQKRGRLKRSGCPLNYGGTSLRSTISGGSSLSFQTFLVSLTKPGAPDVLQSGFPVADFDKNRSMSMLHPLKLQPPNVKSDRLLKNLATYTNQSGVGPLDYVCLIQAYQSVGQRKQGHRWL